MQPTRNHRDDATHHVSPASQLGTWVLLFVLVGVAYGWSLKNGLVGDDLLFMQNDARLESVEGARELFSAPLWEGVADSSESKLVGQYYRPLQLLPLFISKAYFGGAAWPCHLLSLIFHFANSVLVCALMWRLTRRPRLAMILASLFAIHPVNAESVLWISDFGGLGATFCTLAIVVLHSRERWILPGALLAAPLYLSAMWFKESGILVPLLMMAYDFTVRRSESPDASPTATAFDYAVMFAPLAVYLTLRHHALGVVVPATESLGLDALDLAINAVASVPNYLASFVWTFDPHAFADFGIVTSIHDPRFMAGLAITVVGSLMVLASWRTRPTVAFGILWAVVGLSPFLLIRWPNLAVFAERFLYLPSVGLIAAGAGMTGLVTIEWGTAKRTVFGVVAIALATLFVWIDVERTQMWKSDKMLQARHTTIAAGR